MGEQRKVCQEFGSDTQFDNTTSIAAHLALGFDDAGALRSFRKIYRRPHARYSHPKRFGVLGSGEVGQALAKGLAANGYETRIGTRSPGKLAKFSRSTGIEEGTFSSVAAWGEAVVLAVLGTARAGGNRSRRADNLNGKLVIDTTNPISDDPPVDGVLRYSPDRTNR